MAKTKPPPEQYATTNRVCCCNVKTAGYIVAIVEIVLCILALYGLFRNFQVFGSPYFFWFFVGIISIIIIIIGIIILILAIVKRKANWVIPHMFSQIFLTLFLFIVALVTAILLLFERYRGIRSLLGQGDYYMSDESTRLLGYLIILVYLAVALLEIFFIWIVYKLYLHLKECERIKNGQFSLLAAYDDEGYNSNVYIAPKNDNAHGGSPSAGDVYPYEPPVTPPPQGYRRAQ
uniref:Uncharacterized protein n=1 Tax=Panagrolaimus superbus TaxID=310955 RepID=A0A914YQR8_9BILA